MRTFVGAFLAFVIGSIAPACSQPTNSTHPAIGLYALPGGTQVYVEYVEEIDGLAMIDFPAGRVRPLRPDEANGFTFGPTLGEADPIVGRLAFTNDRLELREGGTARVGRRVRFRTEDVSFRSGDVTLAGTLTLPRGRGPFPAVVLLHGGGAQTRNFIWVPHFFAARGVAVLAYDKRGVGGSSGDWQTALMEDLASDALAGVEFLRQRRDIRGGRIGLYGSSNGGWVAPLAATRAPDRIAFIIARSASALPQRENIAYEVEGDLRSHGYGDDVVARARDLHLRDISVVAADGEGWEELRTALAAARDEPWFPLTRMPRDLIVRNEENRPHIEAFIARERRDQLDPPALWAQIRQPVLIQIGAVDRYVPGPESAERLGAVLASNPRARVVLYPRAGHPMFDSESGYERDIPRVSRYVEGYLTDLDAFILSIAR